MTELEQMKKMFVRAQLDMRVVVNVYYSRGHTPGGIDVDPDEAHTIIYLNSGSRSCHAFIFDDFGQLVGDEDGGY